MTTAPSLDTLYESLGTTRVRRVRFTKRMLLRRFDAAGTCVWTLWRAACDFAAAHGVPELRVAEFSPRDELAREWVDRCIALVRDWRTGVERESRKRAATSREA